MKNKSLLLIGCIMLLAGWLSAFALNTIPQHNSLYILGPTLLLGVGLGLTHKAVGGKKAAIALAFTAMAGLLLLNQLFPDQSVSFFAFKQRMQGGFKGQVVAIEVQEKESTGVFSTPRTLETFAAVKIQVFTLLPAAPGRMTVDPAGRLYVTFPALGAIYRFSDSNGDGFSDESTLVYAGLDRPSGIVWKDKKLYVAQPDQLLELTGCAGDAQIEQIRVVVAELPDDGGHWMRSLVVGEGNFIYLSVGSRCNACEEKNSLRGTVLKIDPDKGQMTPFASGLRNTVGLAFLPETGTLLGTDIGRNDLGAQLPPDEINQIVAAGNYGWPYCYGNKTVDPQLGSADLCQQTLPPLLDLPAHSQPLGIAFGRQLHAPKSYKNNVYVALHGRSAGKISTPGKLIRIPYTKSQLADHGKEFIRGWGAGEQAWGAPAGVVAGGDGSLYVSDAKAQAIYRISWKDVE